MPKSGGIQGVSPLRLTRPVRLFVAALLALWIGLAGFAATVDAHAELVKTTPTAGDRMDESPAAVELVFNERLDSGGSRLSVLNDASRTVAEGKPERFGEGTGIRLALPRLGEGHYTVSYSVISEDGHPVSGAFVFTVGNPPPLPDGSQLDPHAQVGHVHGVSPADEQPYLLYALRIAYYAGLLVTAGLAIWSLYGGGAAVLRETRELAFGIAGKFTLLSTLAYVAISLKDLAQDEPFSEWLRILQETTVGRLYAAELLLGFAAPLLTGLGRAGRLFWAAVFLGVEAWLGHAASFQPKAYTIGLDFVHLAAASVWAGGLLLLLAVWRKERPEAGRFALAFSRWALVSFLALWVTGVLSVLAFLPSLNYLLFTSWGKWLIAKIAVSVLVAVTAILIRLRLRRGELPRGYLLRTDVGLLAALVFIVGILTYQTPLPKNEPLHFHQMGTDMHVTLRITPNVPGDNAFTVKVWLPETDGKPKDVRLRLLPAGHKSVGAIEVPIQAFDDQEQDAFPDFAKYAYRAEGPFLPFADEWEAQILVTDSKGELLERNTTFRIY